ncbi:AAA family ATPase, partial [Pseudoalteromonas sp. GABNS16A]|uniref:ATP-dependent nuclease n=1 Tax=Pseudoalteromonas sp. GABNS16A TaxID=3025321 RepID=UPI002359485A
FIDNLQLNASSNGSRIMLGGDGRNNQILLALWKAKSLREHDPDHEVVFYCVEEPEAHLHPHQQRKLADYLINELPGQTLITSHSPQITARYSPDSIAHIINRGNGSYAASDGCSECISDTWDELGYRMSILPAEAFFSRVVLLVEGPSEQLFYTELAKANRIDLDFYNISILSVEGVQFKVYLNVLDAMEIPWVLRTDNDVSKITVQGMDRRNLAGINRCLDLLGLPKYNHGDANITAQSLVQTGVWRNVSNQINPHNIFLSKVDLESDLASELPAQLVAYTEKNNAADAIKYMADKKAIRMRGFLNEYKNELNTLGAGELVKPLLRSLEIAQGPAWNG